MSSRRGRYRSSKSSSKKRDSGEVDLPKKSESESEKSETPLAFEYETDEGLSVRIDPTEIRVGREFELTEQDAIELSYGIDWSPVDFEVEKKGLDLTVGGEVGIPGDLLGVSGAVILDLGTGEVKGGEVGIEFGTIDITVGVEGEDACKKSISIGFAGVAIQYTRDDCEDDEEEEDDNRRPTGDDTLSGSGAEDVIDDIMRRIEDIGGCSGIVRFRLHDHWLINYESISELAYFGMQTFQEVGLKLALLHGRRGIKKLWEKAPDSVRNLIPGLDKRIKNWGEEGSQPWSFESFVNTQVEKISDERIQNVVEGLLSGFWEQFGNSVEYVYN